MTLNTNVKNWLAQYAGSSNCFINSGIAYTDPDGVSRVGGTGDVLNALFVAHMVGKDTVVIIGTTNYNSFKITNGGVDVVLDDVNWAYNNDGAPAGEARYCVGSTPTPTPTVTPTVSPTISPGSPLPFEFVGAPIGNPSVTLDLSTLDMSQSGVDRHFQMNSVIITNNSQWPVYLISELRIFSGLQNVCPSTGEIFKGLNRTETSNRSVRVTTLDPGVTDSINLDFFQPGSILGVNTVCLYIHGSFNRQAVIEEVAPITT